MDKFTLKATKRTETGRKISRLRAQGILPANIYGKKVKSQAIQLPEKDFNEVFLKAGETGLIELIVDAEKKPVLIHNIQYHPIFNSPLHVDFYQVDLKEKVTAKVPVLIIGEAPAVKDKVGVLLQLLYVIEVEALPGDLIDKIEVDTGKLAAIGECIKVSDLKVSDKIRILNEQGQEVVKVAPLVSKEAEQMAKEEAAQAAAAAAAAAGAAAETTEGTGATPSITPESATKPVGEAKAEEVKKD